MPTLNTVVFIMLEVFINTLFIYSYVNLDKYSIYFINLNNLSLTNYLHHRDDVASHFAKRKITKDKYADDLKRE